jgi:hypothetical protein
MITLQRITSEYIESEDRIRLTATTGARETLILWITQRLLIRLIGHFLKWLDKEAPEVARSSAVGSEAKSALQGMAQQSAAAKLQEQSAVTANPDSAALLVKEIDIKMSEAVVLLVFKCDDGRKAELSFTIQQLRQWLGMIHQLWRQAEWPVSVWPDWMDDKQQPDSVDADSPVH